MQNPKGDGRIPERTRLDDDREDVPLGSLAAPSEALADLRERKVGRVADVAAVVLLVAGVAVVLRVPDPDALHTSHGTGHVQMHKARAM